MHKPSSPPALRTALAVWARIALLSFGGPAGQIAVMHRILVDEKRWISDQRFLHGLNYCLLLPGPEAQQLATYIGWLMHGVRGGFAAGLLFILPGYISIMALSILYVQLGQTTAAQGLFLGLKAAVLAIVAGAIVRLGRRILDHGWLVAIAFLSFIGLFVLRIPFPLLIIGAGFIGFCAHWLGHAAPPPPEVEPDTTAARRRGPEYRAAILCALAWLTPVLTLLAFSGPDHVFSQIGVFFSKMAVVTFGGAYAVLSYVAQQAVDHYGWLKPGEMLDGLGMAETTPGPLIIVTQFVGFLAAYRQAGTLDPLAAGIIGGTLTSWVTFTPCFLWIFLGAPYIEKLRHHRGLQSALRFIGAAVVGVIVNLALWFALHTLFRQTETIAAMGVGLDIPQWDSLDPAALVLSLVTLSLLFILRQGTLAIIVTGTAMGLIWTQIS